ncbi:Protein maternal effect lethal 26 like protein [Argiope bruennichi]|uniref:Protein maternal effect lethal 26 like protein n=1 Tax=Argiope bruennichi TaxID=94029 RepID=A0A8T0E8W5_ARGBR|nr:Protein maternal effect lethal 26 like protein [Argiope bruennichi]
MVICVRKSVHEGDLKWIIDNACKLARRLRSSNFSLQTQCQPEFQIVAKFNERYPEAHVTNVNIGIQRIDSGDKSVYVTAIAQLLNTDDDEYCREEVSFTCPSGGAPFYIFSELFSDSASKLSFPRCKKGISSDDIDDLFHLQVKNLVASHGNVNRIFILPKDILIVKVHIKTFGCCTSTNKEEVPDVPERLTLKSHVDQLLNDFKRAYQHQELTDIDLVVDDKTIRAHKFVLQARSPVFRNMFEHNLSETTAGTIQIDDIEYTVLQALIWYLYTAVVQKLPYDDLCDLYEAADKYQVSSLQKECAEILKSMLSVDTACRILVLADLHNDSYLRQEAVDYIWSNFAKVKATEEWELTMHSHQKVASDVLEKVCNFRPEVKS